MILCFYICDTLQNKAPNKSLLYEITLTIPLKQNVALQMCFSHKFVISEAGLGKGWSLFGKVWLYLLWNGPIIFQFHCNGDHTKNTPLSQEVQFVVHILWSKHIQADTPKGSIPACSGMWFCINVICWNTFYNEQYIL